MNGYIYDIDTRKIATKIPNVTKCNTIMAKGDILARAGTGQLIISDQEFSEGDILPVGTPDLSSGVPLLIE